MKKIILFLHLLLLASHFASAQKITNKIKDIGFTQEGLVSTTAFDKIVYKDYNSFGLVAAATPKTNLVLDVLEKSLEFNYNRFSNGKESFVTSKPFAVIGNIKMDFDNETKQSSLFSDSKLAPNISLSLGIRIFRYAKANYTSTEKTNVDNRILQADSIRNHLMNNGVSAFAKLSGTPKTDSAVKGYYDSLFLGKVDTCFAHPERCFNKYITERFDAAKETIYSQAQFSKKIYQWWDTKVEYARPSINTLNRANALTERLGTIVYNNTVVSLAFNSLLVYKNYSKYFVAGASIGSSDNSSELTAIDVNYLKKVDSSGSNIYYEKVNKSAYDTTELSKATLLKLKFEYYYFFKKNIGFTASIKCDIGDGLPVARKLLAGFILPFKKKDETKAALTFYYQASSNSKLILSGRYKSDVGIKVGVPLEGMF